MQEDLGRSIFALGSFVRYVAFGEGQRIAMRERDGLTDASDSVSDRFEELFVNPTLIALARQRGELDCGGLRHIVVGYGHFSQLIIPTVTGHVSVALELGVNSEDVALEVTELLDRHGVAPRGGSNREQ